MLKYCYSLFLGCLAISAFSQQQEAETLFKTGHYSKAINSYLQCTDCDTVNSYHKIAQAYNALGNYAKALDYYENVLQLDNDDSIIHYEYAKLLAKTKNYTDAKNAFKTLIQLDSLNPNFHYQLGLVLEKQKDTLALNEFKTTFTLDSTHQKAVFKIAKQHLKKRQFKNAHQFIDIGLKTYEGSIELISLKAQTYYYEHDYQKAVVWFNKLVNLGETSEFIYEKLSLSYAKKSDYKEAIFYQKKALKFDPNNPRANYVIGAYYEKLSDFKNAEDYMSKALKALDQPLATEYRKLGTVFNRQKKYPEAIKALQKSLKEDPTDMLTAFYMLRTKDEFYADLDTKIKLYETS